MFFKPFNNGDDGDSFAREVGKAVLIAGLSALATEVATWIVEEVRAAVKPPPRDEEKREAKG